MSTAISAENLSKAYRLGSRDEAPDTFVGAVSHLVRAPLRNWRRLRNLSIDANRLAPGTPGVNGHAHPGRGQAAMPEDDILWALRDVSFQIDEGEVVGFIGRNGAGKSTLLKVLSRITEPTSGRVSIHGRVSSLLEVGTGFHPELSGRDNVYLNGTILGMTKREIDRKFDEIVDFSGVERFLDTPIKRYSSGMKVRLAFAVAAHLEPEILIVDEVLAVGDAEFQKKCLGKMQDVARGGRTILFVSHNMAAVEALCSRGYVLAGGAVVCSGSVPECVGHYRELNGLKSGSAVYSPVPDADLDFLSCSLASFDDLQSSTPNLSEDLRIEVVYRVNRQLSNVQVVFHVWTARDAHVIAAADIDSERSLSGSRAVGTYQATFIIPRYTLGCGSYRTTLAAGEPDRRLIAQVDGPWFELSARGTPVASWSGGRRDAILSVPIESTTVAIGNRHPLLSSAGELAV